ncbi:MAG: acylphosphatase [Xanthomonadales bacterium]|nr:acylphosphatase [Xanthomonadales bacterium]|tara:strand:- start:88 stop:366 length:279 start_codon:yes stop_codon:yes gene_type:complete
MSETRYFRVTGTVQGVGFRAATQAEARRLDLAGWVANRPDGDVELTAAGPAEALDTLARWLGYGPASAVVHEVAETDMKDTPTALKQPFEIR